MNNSKPIQEGRSYKGGRNTNKPTTPRPNTQPMGQGSQTTDSRSSDSNTAESSDNN